MDKNRGPAQRELHRGEGPGPRARVPVQGGGGGRRLPDPQQDPGRAHLRPPSCSGWAGPDNPGLIRVVHRDAASRDIPPVCVCGGLPG